MEGLGSATEFSVKIVKGREVAPGFLVIRLQA